MSCFVPNCNNSVGVPFPRDRSARKLWIDSLKLKKSPTPSSIVCLDHFKESDLNEDCDTATRPSNRLKKGCIPCIINPHEIEAVKSTEFVAHKDETDTCRICNTNEFLEKCIFDAFDGDVSIMSVIMLCCHPVTMTENDNLPKHICTPCLNQLQESYKFRLKCLETDEWLRNKKQTVDSGKRKHSEYPEKSKRIRIDEPSKSNKTGGSISPEIEYDPLDITEESIKDEDEESNEDQQADVSLESQSISKIKDSNTKDVVSEDKETTHEAKESSTGQVTKNDPPPLVPFDTPPPLVPIERNKQAELNINAKYDEIEKNLEAIHGMSSGIVQQDEKSPSPVKVQAPAKLPPKPKSGKIIPKQKHPVKTRNTIVKLESTGDTHKIISLPRGITITPAEVYESHKGIFPCVITYGLQGSFFVMADEYLFTFGLLKGKVRFLHCVLPSCRATAEQKLLEGKTYEDFIDVKIPHNHQAPTSQVRKKHMFFHVMRKRMQLDKTLNIRSIYEEVCNMEPEIRTLVPLRNVINEICRYQVSNKLPHINSFEEFYDNIESEEFEKLHFTNNNNQFYQEKFSCDDGSLAVVFCNTVVIDEISDSKIMYVDASFKIDTYEDFKYQLVTVLVWLDDSYYPILFALVNKKTQEIFKKVFKHLHDVLAPDLKPHEIVTDYEANLYYALGETYLDSHIGGSVFYYTQNLYKKICSLNLSRDLETNSNLRNVYHMLLMLPLLPVNTILDGLNNIEIQARDMCLTDIARPIFDHVRAQWILNVTPELFCVHRLENRINENVIAPFKKLRDFLLLFKGKATQSQITIAQVVEKLIELESFLHGMYTRVDKKSFGRDLSSFQKKNVLRAWQFIEAHPKINVNNFFQKVLGYIKCMENQLWIWGFYRFMGDTDDVLISASNFSIISEGMEDECIAPDCEGYVDVVEGQADDSDLSTGNRSDPTIVMEAVIDNDGGVVLQSNNVNESKQFEKAFLKYVQYQ